MEGTIHCTFGKTFCKYLALLTHPGVYILSRSQPQQDVRRGHRGTTVSTVSAHSIWILNVELI